MIRLFLAREIWGVRRDMRPGRRDREDSVAEGNAWEGVEEFLSAGGVARRALEKTFGI